MASIATRFSRRVASRYCGGRGFSASRYCGGRGFSASAAASSAVDRTALHEALGISMDWSNPRTQALGGNVFAEFTMLAMELDAVNLGQGFPNFPAPDFLKEAAARAVAENHNQYTRPGGTPAVVEVLANFYSPRFGRTLNGMGEIVTVNGAQEGLYAIITAFCEAGDEVVCVEPYFDAYKNACTLVGATPVGVPLRRVRDTGHTSDYELDVAELERAITPRSKLLVLNTPHNPTGKVFSRDELEAVAAVVRRHPSLLVLSDEVYEFMCFDGLRHERFATLDGMWDRTFSLYSAGKTFSATGWRVGYAIAAEHLAAPLLKAHQAIPFCVATPLEVAVAHAFAAAEREGYFESLPARLQGYRDTLVASLRGAGMAPIVPEGGYFLMASTDTLAGPAGAAPVEASRPDLPLGERRDFHINRWLTREVGVTGIPPSAFYSPENRHLADDIMRFAFCKDEATLAAAGERLGTFSGGMK